MGCREGPFRDRKRDRGVAPTGSCGSGSRGFQRMRMKSSSEGQAEARSRARRALVAKVTAQVDELGFLG